MEELDEFLSMISKMIKLFGYTSTSLDKDQAMKFVWENVASGHKKVIFNIKWNNESNHYFLNAGAYDQE